jgi:cation diffusion facilitator CzcD-associated flavoprotein CzcO
MLNSSTSATEPRICIVGAGMSGILMAIKLLEAGIDNFVIYEKTNAISGTWQQNRYPGVACDVASFTYCYSFEPNLDWTHRFSPGPEIRAYFERVVEKYGVRPYIRFNTEVTTASFEGTQWRVNSSDGKEELFDVYVAATGPLNKLHYPNIKGLSDFKGTCCHTADWNDDYDYTGKRVGIIGTGSSSVQSIDPLSAKAEHLTIFQRTPQWVIKTDNIEYSPLARKLKHLFPVLGELTRWFYSWIGDQFGLAALKDGFRRKLVFKGCYQALATIKDDELRKKLTPDYLPMCRRMIMSGTFHDAVQRPNVLLETQAIECITPNGIKMADGTEHKLDFLILATGFYFNVQNVKQVTGLNGLSLADYWQNGIKSYRSITVPGFPNYFMLIGPGSPITNLSLIEIAEISVNYVMQCIQKIRDKEIIAIAPKLTISEVYTNKLRNAFGDTIWTSGCSSWYLDADGIPGTYPGPPSEFRKELNTINLNEFDVIRP